MERILGTRIASTANKRTKHMNKRALKENKILDQIVDFKGGGEGTRPLGASRGKYMYDMIVYIRDKITSKRGKEGQDLDNVFKGWDSFQYDRVILC